MIKPFLALVALVLLAGCSTPAPPPSPTLVPTATLALVVTTPTSDEYAVYDAVINSNWPGQAQIVIEATTATNYEPSGRPDLRGYVAGQLPGLQEQAIESFLAANQSTDPLASQFHIPSAYVLLSKAFIDKLFDRDLQASWRRFHAAYPGSQGLLAFSRVGFNAAMDQALVYYRNGKGGLDAVGYMVLLEKDPAGWVVKRQLLLWEA